MSNFRGIILEGYSNAGKTSVLKALKQLHANDDAERSVIVLSEHYSQVLHKINGELKLLSRDEHLQVLRERVTMLKMLNNWSREFGQTQRSKGLFFILERFHLNHRVAFSHSLSDEIKELEAQLFEMGARCTLLTVSPENVEQRISSRNPNEWQEKTSKEMKVACELLLEQQKEYRNQAGNSIIPTIEINTDNKDWESYAKQIYFFN
ncbi:AAA family ATPase [Lysinibacillus fusiformis]|uniref:AAA family ATPase n=1 Tax=Lysinibacillus fusiformis TaxID=28031 RepID=UPI000469EE87|nr:AAA family ATPase [Lysinibacillus fusiformis]